MMSGVFKHVYRGCGVYWFGRHGYGDETNPGYDTVAQMHAAIDAKIAAEEAARPPHLKHWDTLGDAERRKWRQACQYTELSAAELAYTNLG